MLAQWQWSNIELEFCYIQSLAERLTASAFDAVSSRLRKRTDVVATMSKVQTKQDQSVRLGVGEGINIRTMMDRVLS